MILSRFCKIYPQNDDSVILYSTKKASIIIVPKAMITEIEKGRITGEEKITLSDLGFLVEDAQIEKKEVLNFYDDLNQMSRLFAAKIAMNLDCNLACKYCFEGLRKGKYFMTRETADLFLEYVKRVVRSGKKNIILTFYGGEPLLSLELISYISEEIKRFSERENLTYHGSIITNGTLLTSSVSKRLKGAGIDEAVVTLDGPKDIHDGFRPFKNGRGSFDLIIKNIMEACAVLEITINGNFTHENYIEFPKLLDYMADKGLTSDKIPMVRVGPVTKETGGIALPDFRDGCDSYNEPWLMDADIFLREEMLRRGYKTYKLSPAICSLDIKDHMLINYDGSIYKCPGFIGRNEFRVGNVISGIDNQKVKLPENWKNEECLQCCYLPLCFGGCRYMKLVREDSMEGVDCRKSYFDAVLEPIILQNLKYGL